MRLLFVCLGVLSSSAAWADAVDRTCAKITRGAAPGFRQVWSFEETSPGVYAAITIPIAASKITLTRSVARAEEGADWVSEDGATEISDRRVTGRLLLGLVVKGPDGRPRPLDAFDCGPR